MRDGPERRRRVEDLRQVAAADHADDRGDRRLERPEPEPLEPEDREGRDAGEYRGRKEADPEQEVESDRGPEELRQVRRHGDQLRLRPEAERGSARELLAADLRQVPPGGDPEL